VSVHSSVQYAAHAVTAPHPPRPGPEGFERLARRYARLLEVLPAAVVVLDSDGMVQESNSAAEALLGQPLNGEPWCAVIERAFDPRLDDGHEVSLRDGRLVSISIVPLGEEPGQVVLLKDLTETRQLQERLGHQKRLAAMGEMAATLAHQIRTPLASALLYMSHLARPALDPALRARIAGRIQERLHHLERVIADILVFARGGSFEVTPLTAAELLGAVCESLAPQWQACDATIEIRDHTAGAWLLGSREALASALVNLATNARQARPQGLRLELAARRGPDETIVIAVRDNGPGVPPELRDRIFEPFFTTRASGTGLGLAVVRAIAEAHRGSVRLDPDTGAGSCFALSLPLYAADDAPAETVATEATPDPRLATRDSRLKKALP
jgi:two-component system sensor histidine kinase FlrB